MSLLDPASCLYTKTIVYELFSNDSGLKKDSAESMKQFVGRVKVAHSSRRCHLSLPITAFHLKHLQINFQQSSNHSSGLAKRVLKKEIN